MAVLPEGMNKLNPQDTRGSFGIIERYIGYMRERIEHSHSILDAARMEQRISAMEKDIAEIKKSLNNGG